MHGKAKKGFRVPAGLLAGGVGLLMGWPAYGESFQSALEDAWKVGPHVRFLEKKAAADKQDLYTAVSSWLPKVSYEYKRPKTKSTTKAPAPEVFTSQRATVKTLTVSQHIMDFGGTITGIVEAFEQKKILDLQLLADQEQTILDVAKVYTGLVVAWQDLQVQQTRIKELESNLRLTQVKQSRGQVSQADLLEAEASLQNALSKKSTADGTYRNAIAAFETIVGRAPSDMQLEPPPLPAQMPQSLDQALDLAKQNNPNLLIARLNDKVASLEQYGSYSRALPSLDAFYSRSRTKSRDLVGQKDDTDVDEKSYGLSLTWTPFTGGAHFAAVRKARYNALASRFHFQEVQQEIISQVRGLWYGFAAAQSALEAARKGSQASDAVLKAASLRYRSGLISASELLQIEGHWVDAHRQIAEAQQTYTDTAFSLAFATGLLAPASFRLEPLEMGAYVPLLNILP